MFSDREDGALPEEVEQYMYQFLGLFNPTTCAVRLVSTKANQCMLRFFQAKRFEGISSVRHLVNLCVANGQVALNTLQNLSDKLGRYDADAIKQLDAARYYSRNAEKPTDMSLINGSYFIEIANAHAAAKQYLREHIEQFRDRLPPTLLTELTQDGPPQPPGF